jgi:hypothetical protein
MLASLVRLSALEMEDFSIRLVTLQSFEFYEYTAEIIEKHLPPTTPQDLAKQIRTGSRPSTPQGTSVKMIEMGNQFYLPQYNIAIFQCIV